MVTTFGPDDDATNRSDPGIKRRPKDRKDQINRAAAETFSELGYQATSMEMIAAKVDISAPALYRHYHSKYEMFAAVVSALGRELVECTDFLDEVSEADLAADPGAVRDRVIDVLIDAALATRRSGGLYRWQTRYLQDADHDQFMGSMWMVNKRIQRPLRALRPKLSAIQRSTLSVALLSLIGSITDHRITMADDELRALLSGASSAMLAATLPDPENCGNERPAVWRIFTPDAGPYDALLYGAMVLFGIHGYAETSVTQIAEEVGVPISGVYRYFSGKGEILTTGLQRAADRVAGELSAVAAVFPDQREALGRLIEAFVATGFANPELAAVYDTERANLAPDDLERLRYTERVVIDAWIPPLSAVRPELHVAQARVLIHAAVALVTGVGRSTRDRRRSGDEPDADDVAYTQACVRSLMRSVLFGFEDWQPPPQGLAQEIE